MYLIIMNVQNTTLATRSPFSGMLRVAAVTGAFALSMLPSIKPASAGEQTFCIGPYSPLAGCMGEVYTRKVPDLVIPRDPSKAMNTTGMVNANAVVDTSGGRILLVHINRK